MAQLNPTDPPPPRSDAASGAPAPAGPNRATRRTFRPSMGTLHAAPSAAQHPLADAADTYTSARPAPEGSLSPPVGARPAPKFGDAMAASPSGQGKKTQSAHLTSHLNPWIPVPWTHQAPPVPPRPADVDLEAQALAETASLPVHRVCTSPGTVTLKAPVAALAKACVGQKVCINLIDGEMLYALSAAELETLLDALVATKHQSHWHYSRYDNLSRFNPLPWLRSTTLSGSSALFLHLLAQKEVQAAEMVACRRPVEIALELGEAIPDLFTLPLLGRIFGSFVPEVTRPHDDPNLDENDQLSALAVLVAAFVSVHVKADPDLLEDWTIKLLRRFESSGFESTSANVGLMAGAILAGNLRYGAAITARDNTIKKYVWFVVALAFAGLSFVENSDIDGGLTVGAFLLGALFDSYWPVRDLSLDINRLEGKLRTKMLKVEMFRNSYENTEMMAWIDNVKKCNGF